MKTPEKPAFGFPCNHCGICCVGSICPAGKMALPDAVAPCPLLRHEDGKALCGLVLTEARNGLEPIIAMTLGIGFGCSMPDATTTDVEQEAFDRVSQYRADREWELLRKNRIAKIQVFAA